jgi:hypothetical protein
MTLHSPEFLEQGETVLFAHEDVQKHQVDAVILEIAERFRGGLERPQGYIEGTDAEFV